MSKITFRADDDLVDRLEDCDASKSEVMREALRTYLDGSEVVRGGSVGTDTELTDLVDERVTLALADRLDDIVQSGPQDVNVTITLDEPASNATQTSGPAKRDETHRLDEQADAGDRTCAKCGESIAGDHVYCPNCGEKAARRIYCECGDELRSDWAFCPSCGRRTPAADVLKR